MSRVYDYIIIGSGVAGNVCAFILQKKGFSCLILEKEKIRKEKICGGGIPRKAIDMLIGMGMDIQKFFDSDVSLINGDIAFINGQYITNYYESDCYAAACRRKIFDDFLLNEAIGYGAEIKWGECVNKIEYKDNIYQVNDFLSKKVIASPGARGLKNRYYKGQSIGISAQIYGNTDLRNDIFHYFYYKNTDDTYFWIFPIGKKLWNIGIWFRSPSHEMNNEYKKCWEKYVESNFCNYTYIQRPMAEFCGNVNISIEEKIITDAIGDYGGNNNIINGGGIYRAIKSAIKYTDTEFLSNRNNFSL